MGVEWVEFDVKLTKDQVPILFHDETLERTTGASGNVADMMFEDIRNLEAGSWFGDTFAGIRIPTLEEAVEVLLERKLGFSLCSPVLPQIALADFLESGAYDSHLRRIRRVFEENLALMTRTIEASFPAATKISQPAGGFVLWLELPRRFDSRALFDEALEQGICFAPGDVFSASRRFRNCLRLSAGHAWNDDMEQGIRRLGRLAQTLLAR